MTAQAREQAMDLVQQIRNLTRSATDEDVDPDDVAEAVGERCDQLDMLISPIDIVRPMKES